MVLNGHFRNKAYNSVSWACLYSLTPKRNEGSTIQYMAIGNWELMQECFPKHSRMGTARWNKTMRQTKTDRRDAWVWKKVQRARKISPDGLPHPNRNTIIINNLVKFYKKWKKHNEIQLTKNNMDLNNRKMTNHPPSAAGREYGKKVKLARINEVPTAYDHHLIKTQY